MQMNRPTYSHPALLLILVLFLAACNSIGVYEKNVPIPGQSWSSSFKPRLEFGITDSSSLYNIYVVLRHTDAYEYNNIWLNIGIQAPGDSLHSSRLDLTLASDEKGWLGKGMDDIYEYRIPLNDQPLRLKPGQYVFTLENIMREDPLPHVLDAGIRVEKVQP